jgi:hypothetical protein
MKLITMSNISSIGWTRVNNITPSGFRGKKRFSLREKYHPFGVQRKKEILSSREISPLRSWFSKNKLSEKKFLRLSKNSAAMPDQNPFVRSKAVVE